MPVLSDPLDFRKVTSFYLYGEETPPPTFEDRLRPAGSPPVELDVGASFWAGDGAGRYAFAAFTRNQFVNSFFANPVNLGFEVQQLYSDRLTAQGGVGPVAITVGELKSLLGMGDQAFRVSFAQYGYGVGDSDYAARTFIYNNQTFNLSDGTTFLFHTNAALNSISNLEFKPFADNFDFVTEGTFAQLGNDGVLRSTIDPDKIGAQVQLNIPQSPARSFGPSDFAAFNSIPYDNSVIVLATSTLPAMLEIIEQLEAAPPIFEYYVDGTPIIYGTNGAEGESYWTAKIGQLNETPLAIIAIGGEQADSINGLAGRDRLLGGDDNDKLRGNAGDDYLDGGRNIDQALFDDRGGTIELSSGGESPLTPELTPKETAPFFTVARGTEVDTLHSIEKITLSDFADTLKILANTDLKGLKEIDAGSSASGTLDTIDLSQLGTGLALVGSSVVGQEIDLMLLNFEKIIGLSTDDNILLDQTTFKEVHGGGGNDVIIGGATSASLFGDDGDDTLAAGGAGDVLDGGISDGAGDIYIGGAGADTFIIGNGVYAKQGIDNAFTIENAGVNDRLVLRLSDTFGASETSATKAIVLTGGVAILGDTFNGFPDPAEALVAGVSNTIVSPAAIGSGSDGAAVTAYTTSNVRPELGNFFVLYYWDKLENTLDIWINTSYGDFSVYIEDFYEGNLGISFSMTQAPYRQYLHGEGSEAVIQDSWSTYNSLLTSQIQSMQLVDVPTPGDFVDGTFTAWTTSVPPASEEDFYMWPASEGDLYGEHFDPSEGSSGGPGGPGGLGGPGDAGDDMIYGFGGNDTLNTGTGNDTLTGGGGNDIFVFKPGFGSDIIVDFAAGNGASDVVEFSTSLFADFSAVLANAAQVGSDTVITFDAQNKITLASVTMANLAADDFRHV